MNLSIARGWIRQFARNAGDSSMYSDADIDRALLFVCQRFCRNTHALMGWQTLALAIGDESFELQSGPYITPENLKTLTLSDACDPLEIVDWVDLNRDRQTAKTAKPTEAAILGNVSAPITTCTSAAADDEFGFATTSVAAALPPGGPAPGWRVRYAGQTRRALTWDPDDFSGTVDVAFSATMEGGNPIEFFQWPTADAPATPWAGNFTVQIYPTNDAVRTLTARSWLPFSLWTPGVSDALAQNVQLNIPDAWMMQILPFGPPAALQLHEPEHLAAGVSKRWDEYLAIEKSFMGGGNLAKRIMDRKKRD